MTNLPISVKSSVFVAAQRGFTLLELMTALFLVAILMALGMPSFKEYITRNTVTGLQHELRAALNTARSEAATRNKPTAICASTNMTTCSSTSWSQGWLVFVDDSGSGGSGTARNGQRESTELLIAAVTKTGDYPIIAKNTSGTAIYNLRFNERGFSANNARAVLVVCDSEHAARYTRGLLIEHTGRVMGTRDTDGDGLHDSIFADGSGTTTTASLSCT